MRRNVVLGLVALALGLATAATGSPLSPVRFVSPGTKAISNPAAALDAQGRLFLAWVQGAEGQPDAVYVARVEPGAATVEAPVRVTSTEEMVGSRHQSPGLAVGPGGEVYVTWGLKLGDGAGTAVRLGRSLDGGRTFGAPVTLNDDALPVSHGFEGVTVAPDGTVHAGWTDARDRANSDAVSLYAARSRDRGATFGRNVRVDDRTCVCCRIGLAAGADGSVYAGFRRVDAATGVRDIAVARSADGGATFARPVIVHHDHWKIPACPHRGPSLGLDRAGRLYVAWYTEGKEEPAIHLATSDDQGKTFSAPHSLGYPRGTFPDAPAIAVSGAGTVFATWHESSPVVSRVFLRQSSDRGRSIRVPQPVNEGPRRAHHAVVALGGGRLALAWADEHYTGSRIAFRLMTVEP
jgi:hypothetical protein